MKTSSVLTRDELEWVDARRGPTFDFTLQIIDRLVAKVERLEAVAEAARVHMTRTDTRHTPACRPSMKDNHNWCSTCNLMRALAELEKP